MHNKTVSQLINRDKQTFMQRCMALRKLLYLSYISVPIFTNRFVKFVSQSIT